MPDELDKIRDAIARLKGWDKDHSGVWCQPHESGNGWHCEHENHPVPASLDWVAQQWPKLWAFTIRSPEGQSNFFDAFASSPTGYMRNTTGQTELHARLALYLAVLEAEHKETP